MFEATQIEKKFFTDNVAPEMRGTTVSIKDMISNKKALSIYVHDSKVHDANFAFLSTSLAKLHTKLYEPKWNTTYARDVAINVGGGFVDYVEYFTVDWAGIMNEFRNVVGNNANYIPRVNAGLNQKRVNVFTWEVAYDLRFVELEKMKKVQLQKSIEEIYKNIIVAGFDLFVQKIAYLGTAGGTGLFNSSKVYTGTIDNSTATGAGFTGMSDEDVLSFFNGVISYYLANSNMNLKLVPNRFLVPSYVGKDLSSRMNALYTANLRKFITEHNLYSDESDNEEKLVIESRSDLDTLGAANKGRIVAYRKEEEFVRIDMPYPMQHFITLPNIDKHAYTSAFVGQVSEIQMPYNTAAAELGAVSYWDFTN